MNPSDDITFPVEGLRVPLRHSRINYFIVGSQVDRFRERIRLPEIPPVTKRSPASVFKISKILPSLPGSFVIKQNGMIADDPDSKRNQVPDLFFHPSRRRIVVVVEVDNYFPFRQFVNRVPFGRNVRRSRSIEADSWILGNYVGDRFFAVVQDNKFLRFPGLGKEGSYHLRNVKPPVLRRTDGGN